MRWNCFECDGTGHSIFSCSEIGKLCKKGIIHQDNQKRLCWEKIKSNEAPVVQSMNKRTWKKKILKQEKLKNQMIMTHIDVILVEKTDVVFDTEDVNVQLFLICS